jgi:hypothetical protein
VTTLNARERKALNNLAACGERGGTLGDMPFTGQKTIKSLIEKGLIVELAIRRNGRDTYGITSAGENARWAKA